MAERSRTDVLCDFMNEIFRLLQNREMDPHLSVFVLCISFLMCLHWLNYE